jgi:hypothetical protein
MQIGRLALHGVASADAKQLAAVLKAELAGLAREPGQVFVSISAPRVGTVHFEASEGLDRTGRAAGAALWSGIRQSGRGER